MKTPIQTRVDSPMEEQQFDTVMRQQLETMCTARQIPGLVLIASDATGSFTYQQAFGSKSLRLGQTDPMQIDAIFDFASFTKIMTSICALQLVEQGMIDLDEDVSRILHELKVLDIITAFDDETQTATLKKAENFITLRHLLTHTAGFSYPLQNPLIMKYKLSNKEEIMDLHSQPMTKEITMPLLFEPGTSFSYGISTDWVGILIGRLAKTSLSEYMEKNLFQPLGIKDIAFHLENRPDMKANRIGCCTRQGNMNPAGKCTDVSALAEDAGPKGWDFEAPPYEDWGGNGALGSLTDYIKVLRALLATETPILKQDSIVELFRPQLGPDAQAALGTFIAKSETNGGPKTATSLNWGLGGMINMEDLDCGRKKGSLCWYGMPNLIWWVDRASGYCGASGSRLFPYDDERMAAVHYGFEKMIYDVASRRFEVDSAKIQEAEKFVSTKPRAGSWVLKLLYKLSCGRFGSY